MNSEGTIEITRFALLRIAHELLLRLHTDSLSQLDRDRFNQAMRILQAMRDGNMEAVLSAGWHEVEPKDLIR